MLAESLTVSEQPRLDPADVRAPLRDVLDALCEGIRRADRTDNGTETTEVFALEQDAIRSVETQVPAQLQRVSSLAITFRVNALKAARAGDRTTADEEVLRARNSVARFSSPELTRLADTLTDAAAAYVDYKAGRYLAARASIEASLSATNRLLMDYRCEAMHLRRIHLVANLMRMEARSGDGAGAMDLASGLLDYIEGRDESWPLPGFEVEWPIGTVPLTNRVAMSSQIGREIALALSLPKRDTAALLVQVAPHAASSAMGACAAFPSVHQWLHLRWTHCHDGPREFLHSAHGFFSVKQPGPFWSDAARLLDQCCAALDLDEAANVRHALKMVSMAKTTNTASIRA